MKILELNCEKKRNTFQEKKVCKGLKKSSIATQLSFADYKKCLKDATLIYKSFKSLKSKNHRIKTCFQRKIALSAMDSKRYILNCGHHTLSLGSCLIKKYQVHGCPKCK